MVAGPGPSVGEDAAVPSLPLHVDPTVDLRAGFGAIRDELELPDDFPAEVLAEAEAAARRGPGIPADADLRDVPFLTVDPPSSTDLDQALALERNGPGYLVRYAIADVAAFVTPGGAVDAEARRRGVTVYLPDGKVPLHPPVLSEGAASLLPDGDRQAVVWEVELDADGAPTDVRVRRATVRSRAKLSYEEVQRSVDRGTAEEPLLLLREVGELRAAQEAARGGVSLPLPEQQVVEIAGRYELEYRAPLASEGWSAQLSLLTGMCAARLMLDGGVGVLRTLPPAPDDAVDVLRRHAVALGVPWPEGSTYGEVIRALDPTTPPAAAFLVQAVRLFRGAGYLAFDAGSEDGDGGVGTPPVGDESRHAAVAAPYAHVTAPLRRLVDRAGSEVVLALCAGTAVPGWARQALPSLPQAMSAATRREGAADRLATDLVEAATLAGCVGAVVEGVVVKVTDRSVQVQVREPAVVADVGGATAGLGAAVRLRVVSADVGARTVTFAVVP